MKACIRVSAAVNERDGRRRAMFLRWKKAVLVICLTWGRNDRVGSKMTPRLRIRSEGVTVEPSMLREKSLVELVRELGPMMMISDLLQLSLRKFVCIQVFKSVRQAVRVEWVVGMMALVERYNCVSSAYEWN